MKFILCLCFAALSACAFSSRNEDTPPPPPNADVAIAPEAGPIPTAANVADALKPPTESAAKADVTPAAVPAAPTPEPAKVSAPVKSKIKSVDAKQSEQWLKNGNTRFVKGFLRKDGQGKKDIARVSAGQAPHAVVFTCSDSRVPPEIIFDQKLGEIFVVRTAGLNLDKNSVSSIEFAVENLGPRFVMVLGHSGCEGSHNAQNVVEELKKNSPSLRAAVERGDVVIKSALYQLNTGAVTIE